MTRSITFVSVWLGSWSSSPVHYIVQTTQSSTTSEAVSLQTYANSEIRTIECYRRGKVVSRHFRLTGCYDDQHTTVQQNWTAVQCSLATLVGGADRYLRAAGSKAGNWLQCQYANMSVERGTHVGCTSCSLNQMCSCELRWNWTSTQFGVYFRETTVLIEASVHVGTFSGVATDKLRGQLIPLSVYRGKMQWLSATAESRPKVRSWPSAETKRLPKQYTSLLSAPKPNFGRSLLSCTSRLGPQGPI